MKNLVLDASVYGKLFLDEPDSDSVTALFSSLITGAFTWYAPDLVSLEVCACALHYDIPFDVPLNVLETHSNTGLVILAPTRPMWTRAEMIASQGNPKSGYPSLEDSLYHAMAIELDGTFVTADQVHVAKTRSLGHVALLSDLQLNLSVR